MDRQTISYDTIVIGGGQAGLATGYELKRAKRDFIILDAHPRVGDAWRKRWDSLRLFSLARLDSLPGMRFPGSSTSFPTKDEMADYLEAYVAHFTLPVRTSTRVDSVTREDGGFVVMAGGQRFEAEHIIIAMGSMQEGKIPPFAKQLDPNILQVHSSAYKGPAQLRAGGVLVVGSGNSGAEIAKDVAPSRPTWLAGRHIPEIPFRIESQLSKVILSRVLFRFVFHRILTVDSPFARRGNSGGHGTTPLIRVKSKQLASLGVKRVPRVIGVRDGLPLLEDGQIMQVANVIWSTGFNRGLSWIHLPIFEGEKLLQQRGVSTAVPGLFFVGQHFQYALSSGQVQGVGRDAEWVVRVIAAPKPTAGRSPHPVPEAIR